MSTASDRLAVIDQSISETARRISQQRDVVAQLDAEGLADVARLAGSVLYRLEQFLATLHASRHEIIKEMGHAENVCLVARDRPEPTIRPEPSSDRMPLRILTTAI